MGARPSLRVRFTWWFAATLVALYGVAATTIWLYARTSERHYVLLTLKAEAEGLARQVATTGSVDAPEFLAPEVSPFPIWFRLVGPGGIVTQTPGSPVLPVAPEDDAEEGVRTAWSPKVAHSFLVVRHVVGGGAKGLAVEAVGSLRDLRGHERRLAGWLGLGGLVVIPLAALGGFVLAQRALQPLRGLVREIDRLDSARLGDRLVLPSGSVREVTVLTDAFNDLLGRLERSVETMRRFTADASHEIRNPLTVLRTGLEVTLRRPRSPEEYRELLRENLQEIHRLQVVLEGLLALAREAPGTETMLARVPVDFSRLVTETAGSLQVMASERGVSIDEAIEPGLSLDGDPQLLRLVVFNLLDNALKHSPAGERISLEATAAEGGVRLRVADGGPGVPAQDRARVFRRFFRGEGGAAGAGGVGGLGLSVVGWVAERHGGSVRLVDSDHGATFEVALPGGSG